MARGSQRNRTRRRGLRAALGAIAACAAPTAALVAPVVQRARQPVQRSAYDMGGPPGFYTGPERTPILDSVVEPRDMNGLSLPELKQLAHELRWDTIRAVSKTGGHLGSSLGVVE